MKRLPIAFVLVIWAGLLYAADTSDLVPLTALGKRQYKGFEGGLYPDGKNKPPEAHEKAGALLAGQIKPLDAQGKPNQDGRIVLLSIGMSNTTQEFSTFILLAEQEKQKNPKLTIVD